MFNIINLNDNNNELINFYFEKLIFVTTATYPFNFPVKQSSRD